MTKSEFENLKSGDVVYRVIINDTIELPVVEQSVVVGIGENKLDWIVRPYDRNEDYSWGNQYSLFLTRKEAEKAAVDKMNQYIEGWKEQQNRCKNYIKTIENNILKFYQNCIEINPE